MDNKQQIWLAVCEGRFPGKSSHEIMEYHYLAATDWALEIDTDLARLFEQYVMIKKLKGFENGNKENDS